MWFKKKLCKKKLPKIQTENKKRYTADEIKRIVNRSEYIKIITDKKNLNPDDIALAIAVTDKGDIMYIVADK